MKMILKFDSLTNYNIKLIYINIYIMKLLDSILDKVQKYLAKSILEPDVEFEYKFKGVLTNEKFRNLMDYCKDNYSNLYSPWQRQSLAHQGDFCEGR